MADFTPPPLSSRESGSGAFVPPSLDSREKEPTTLLGDVGDTLKQYWDKINPVTQAQGAASLVTTDPRKTIKAYGDQTGALYDATKESFKNGDYATGVRHALGFLLNAIPGVGNALDEAGNKAQKGDYKGAIADTAALATNIAAIKFGPKLLDAATEPGAVPTPGEALDATKAALKAGGPDVLKGGGKIAAGAALDEMGAPYHVGTVMGVREGIPDVGTGIVKGFKAGRQSLRDAVPDVRHVPEVVASADPVLDQIAQRLGAKDYASGGKALREMVDQIKAGQDAATAARAAQPPPVPSQSAPTPVSEPAPPSVPAATVAEVPQEPVPPTAPGIGGGGPLRPPLAPPTPSDALTLKLNKLLRDTRIESGADPDLHLGHEKGVVYKERFGSDGPVIDSSKRRANSTAEIANPGTILTKKAYRDSLPEGRPKSGNLFEKGYKQAVQDELRNLVKR